MLKKLNKYLLIFLLLSLAVVLNALGTLPDNKLHVKVYDVGQGDSVLITTPAGKHILVDGGPGNKLVSLLGASLPFYSRALDVVVLTHPHEDHLSGLVEVLKHYEVAQVWMEKVVHTTDLYLSWLDLLKTKKIKVGAPKIGDQIEYPDGVRIKILWPKQELIKEESDLNSTSIVMLLEYKNFSALLTGDAGQNDQPYAWSLDSWKSRKKLDLLKVPHHGSSTGLKDEFLEVVKPSVAIVSVGAKNKYGHPSKVTLEKLANSDSKVFRTDTSGSVEVVSDGEGWYTKTEK